jgi:putative ABC transport system permease protein
MQSLWADLKYGLRGLRKQPSFTLLGVLALALGIGSATTIFSVIRNVLLDPYPYMDVERNISVQIRDSKDSLRARGRGFFHTAEFLDYAEQTKDVFEDVIAGGFEDVLYSTPQGTEQFNGGLFSGNCFRFLGVPAAHGRLFDEEDARPDAPPVFVMSHKMWVKHFAGDPGIVGRSFVLNGVPTTLAGIMPKRFTKLAADLYRPVVLDRADPVRSRQFYMFQARLKKGVTLEQAEARMNVVARQLAKVYPKDYPDQFTVKVLTWVDGIVGQFKTTLYTLGAAVGLLLLISCANVANMLLGRGASREKEMAVRASLGAGRGRLVGQLLVESLALALLGAVVGCGFAYLGLPALVAAIPEGLIPREAQIRLDVPVLLFSLGVAALTAVVFGLVPALQTVRRDLVEPLRDSGKGLSGGSRGGRLRGALVVAEVALSLVLLAGAGLLMLSFVKLQSQDLGLNPENVLFARLPLPRGQYTTAAAKRQFFSQVIERVRALPGVVSAAATTSLPPYGGPRSEVDVPGREHAETWRAIFQLCSADYFKTLGLRHLRGRLLDERDVDEGRKVAVVSQLFVDQYFGTDDPLGRTITLRALATQPESPVEDPRFEVVGVVATVMNQGIRDAPMPEAFVPYTITGSYDRGLLVRTAGPPEALANSVRDAIWAVDRNVAVTLAGSLVRYLTQFSYAEPRLGLVILGVFASVGLVLVSLGVYSVVAYTVSRQTHEIGIRVALGASRADVLRMVFRMGLGLIGLGVLVGVAVSLGATRVMAHQLFGVTPHDPASLAVAVAVVALAGAAACYFPARRATRVDPMVALRYE